MNGELNLLYDIYYSDDYISLYLKEDEELFNFRYEEKKQFFMNKTIKRPIKKIGNLIIEDGYYDLESAYGYGGFYTNSQNKQFLDRAILEYEKRCKEENIIAEFMRFHPFNNFPLQHKRYLDFNLYDRNIVVKSLDQELFASYQPKIRNAIRRAIEKINIEQSDDIDTFIELYSLTMQKNNASSFYFFEKNLFEKLYNLKNVTLYKVLLDGDIIAMAFFMENNDFMHYHLSANTERSYKVNANYALLHLLFQKAKDENKKYFILGGGVTPSIDDPLFRFKKKFSKEIKPFYISGKIYDQDSYDRYIKLWEAQSGQDVKYFSKYRLGVRHEG